MLSSGTSSSLKHSQVAHGGAGARTVFVFEIVFIFCLNLTRVIGIDSSGSCNLLVLSIIHF